MLSVYNVRRYYIKRDRLSLTAQVTSFFVLLICFFKNRSVFSTILLKKQTYSSIMLYVALLCRILSLPKGGKI